MRTQAEIVQEALDRKEWPARKLALHIGKSPQFIGNVLRGERTLTLDTTIFTIASVLEISSDDLFLAIGRVPPDIVRALQAKPSMTFAVRQVLKR